MTDPRAALAESLDEIDSGTGVLAESIQLLLAERGVLLVTEAQVDAAMREAGIEPSDRKIALAALSGEVDDPAETHRTAMQDGHGRGGTE